MSPRDLVYVGHMLDMAKKAISKTQSLSRGAYDADENLRLALTHLIQIIGEAGRQVSREFSEQHPEIPWADIVGMRHKVVHDYLGVDEDIVWHIGGVVEEVAVGELVEATHQRRRQAPFIERGERFSRRQLGRPAQARDAALVPLLRFELQDVQQQRERRLLLRLDEARDHLARGRRERETR